MAIPFGVIGHFGISVRDPQASAAWWSELGLKELFTFDEGVAIGNDSITLVLYRGTPSPKTIGHVSFHLPTMAALRNALATLQRHGVDVEDPDDPIGPEAPGSPHLGVWFHDPDGYRWELSVQNGANERA